MRWMLFLCVVVFVENTSCHTFRGSEYFEHVYDTVQNNPHILHNILLKVHQLYNGKDNLIDDGVDLQNEDECNFCQNALTAIKAILPETYNTEAESMMTDMCILMLQDTDPHMNGTFMCPGVIKGQGPHLHNVLVHPNTSVPVAKFCESFNRCIPQESGQWVAGSSISAAVEQTVRKRKSGRRPKSGVVRVVQLTDIHLDRHYANGSAVKCGKFVCCRTHDVGSGSAWQWGDYDCNLPPVTMDYIFEEIAKLSPSPDFIIYTGDIASGQYWEESLESQINCSRHLVDALQRKLGMFRVYPTIGNHEMFPTNLFYVPMNETKVFLNSFSDIWEQIAGLGSDQKNSLRDAGYFSIQVRPGLKLISFNTNYWYIYNFYNVKNEGRPEVERMKTFIAQQLAAARSDGSKVILVTHHPIGNRDSIVREMRWFRNLVLSYSDVISLHITGHLHREELRVVMDRSSCQPKHVVFAAPPVVTAPTVNPSFRVFELNETDMSLRDYSQYYFDLKRSFDEDIAPPLVQAYPSAKNEYSLPDLSPASWLGFINRMETDNALFDKLLLNTYTHARNDTSCDADCKKTKLCQWRSSSYDWYLECMRGTDPCRGTDTSTTPIANQARQDRISWSIFLALAICFACRYIRYILNN